MNLTEALTVLIDDARSLPETKHRKQAIKRVEKKLERIRAMHPKRDQFPIFESLEAADSAYGPCPRPTDATREHHWYTSDQPATEEYIWCRCKTCDLPIKLSADAEEYPAI